MKRLQQNEMNILAAEFLLTFRMATPAALVDAIHPGFDKPTGAAGRYIAKLKARGIITDVTSLGTHKTWIAAPNARGNTIRLGWLPTTSAGRMTGIKRQHILTTADIAAQLISGRDTNLLGLDDKEWQAVRKQIKQGSARLIGEKEYDTVWKQLSDRQRQEVRFATNSQPEETATTAAAAAEEYDQRLIYLWTLNTQGLAYLRVPNDHGRGTYELAKPLLGDDLKVPDDQKDRVFVLWDHNPDAVLFIGGEHPQAFAIETELSPKNLHSYIRTLAAYQSPYGLALYRHVTWLCASKGIYHLLQKAVTIVGNKNDQIKLIAIKPANEGEDWYVGTRVVRDVKSEATNSKLEQTKLPIPQIGDHDDSFDPEAFNEPTDDDEDDTTFQLDDDNDAESTDADEDEAMPTIDLAGIAKSASKTAPEPKTRSPFNEYMDA